LTQIFNTVLLDPIYHKFVYQGHKSEFKVIGGKCSFSADSKFETEKVVPTTWRRSRPELQTRQTSKPGIERVQALTNISRSALCCHSNETRAPIENSPNSAQLEGTPLPFPKLHPGPCGSVGMR